MKETIAKTIHLARMKLPEAELERFAKKAEHIVKYVETLNEVDVSKVEATSHAVEIATPFREDKVEKFSGVEKILEIAPNHQDGLFQVPKVIE